MNPEPLENRPEEAAEGGEHPNGWWVGGWSAPIIVVLFTLIWSLGIYYLIGNRPRDWQYGVIPYVPAQSFLSTRPISNQAPPMQVEYPSAIRRFSHGM